MEAALMIGIQGAGKSTFVRDRLYDTHVRLSLDVVRTRWREGVLLRALLESRQRFVVDNTNPTRVERLRYVAPARAAGFRVVAYYLPPDVETSLSRNAARARVVPIAGVLGTRKRLQAPTWDEGYQAIYTVHPRPTGGWAVEPWPRHGW